MPRASGWPALFWVAFKRSRNGMALVDEERRVVEANPAMIELLGARRRDLIGRATWELVVGPPVMSTAEWRMALDRDEFALVAELKRDDGTTVTVQFAGHPETITGRRYVLTVALSHGYTRRRAAPRTTTQTPLSDREREVVLLIGEGRTGPEIAEELQIAHNTVRTHADNAMSKLGARSRAHLVAKAFAEGHLGA